MPDRDYVTLMQEGRSLVEDRKSRFIGRAAHVSGEKDAYSRIEEIRRSEKGAAHNVYAFVIGRNAEVSRSSDDGEPSGTSGRPCLEALTRQGLTDSMVVVTRYFGGILLGKGGLVRAYGLAAREAVEAAGAASLVSYLRTEIALEYSDWDKVSSFLRSEGAKEIAPEYAEKIKLSYAIRKDLESELNIGLTDLLKGKLQILAKHEEERLERIGVSTK